MNPILKSFGRVWKSRLGAILIVVHLLLVVYLLPGTRPLTQEFWDDFNQSAHAIPIAGHTVRIPDEAPLLKIIALADMPSIFICYFFSLFLGVLFPSVTIQTLSWVTAAFLVVITSAQWWLVGFSLEQGVRLIRKKRGDIADRVE